jgi:hypothetical protein
MSVIQTSQYSKLQLLKDSLAKLGKNYIKVHRQLFVDASSIVLKDNLWTFKAVQLGHPIVKNTNYSTFNFNINTFQFESLEDILSGTPLSTDEVKQEIRTALEVELDKL